MLRKGMLGFFVSTNGGRRPSSAPSSPVRERRTVSSTMMADNIASADPIITKWDTDSPTPSLFTNDRCEARLFLRSVHELQLAMDFFVSEDSPASPASRSHHLVRGQTLLQAAMRRLEKEFYHTLSSNPRLLDPDDDVTGSSVALDDLHSIADTMVAAGYGRECIRIYKLLRKSVVVEGLHCLGFEQLTPTQMQKLDWEALDLKICSWLDAAPAAVRTLFSGERVLCDHIFPCSDTIRESCFTDITNDGAVGFLAFPETVANMKPSPEKLFRILDLYDTINNLWPEIESVFSFESASPVRSQALTALLKLAEAARATIAEFESAIQKDTSKTMVAGGGVHPLTRYVINYLALLADYEVPLADFVFESPSSPKSPSFLGRSQRSNPISVRAPLAGFVFDTGSSPSSPKSPSFSPRSPRSGPISVRVAWLVLVLLCKMDGKAEAYREVALSYLFLANNLQYVVNKVQESRLRVLLGDEWVTQNRVKARNYADSYERMAWVKVAAAIPATEQGPAEAQERMRGFGAAFEEACRAHEGWVVTDAAMREELRESVVGLIVPAYRGFYEHCRALLAGREAAAVRFSPEDVRSRLEDLFSGSTDSASGSLSSSGSSRSARLPLPASCFLMV